MTRHVGPGLHPEPLLEELHILKNSPWLIPHINQPAEFERSKQNARNIRICVPTGYSLNKRFSVVNEYMKNFDWAKVNLHKAKINILADPYSRNPHCSLQPAEL